MAMLAMPWNNQALCAGGTGVVRRLGERMSKMNGRTRRRFYDLISRRDGDICKMCGVPASEKQLIIDHINNDNDNNRFDNLQLLCRACNYRKNPRRPVDTCERNPATAISINRTKEPEFRRYVYHKLDEIGGGGRYAISKKYLINSGSEKIGISPITAKRYLDKMCSTEGLLELDGDDFDFVGYKDRDSNQ